MRIIKIVFFILCLLFASESIAKKTPRHIKTKHATSTARHAPTLTITTDDLVGFDDYPRSTKRLINDALALAGQHLRYQFGSTNPQNNGLDCSGTIAYLLKQASISDVPRQADEIYQWAWERGDFFAVNSHRLNSFEFSELKPGDLLFWSGTYPVRRDPEVTHVMLYLGKDKQNRPLMFGATSNRIYHGKQQDGVGVFDFSLPSPHAKARFLGYACIPGLTCT